MSNFNRDPTGQADILKQLILLIEKIRYTRYERWRDDAHPLQRKFTQFELIALALPTYGNFLTGRSNRLPARQQLLELAAYLECSIAETNDLLRCAQYLPEYEPLTSIQYNRALSRATSVMQLITLPAVVMGIGGQGVEINDPFLKINNLKPLDLWLPEQRNIIHSSFDKRLPSHELYRENPDIWDATARGTVQLLKSTTRQIRNERWFVSQIEQWSTLPDFNHYWNTTEWEANPFEETVHTKMRTPLLKEPISEGAIVIPFSKEFEVCLIVWQPLDDATRHLYRMLGCNFEGLRWHEMLKDTLDE